MGNRCVFDDGTGRTVSCAHTAERLSSVLICGDFNNPFYFIFADHKLQNNIQEMFPKNRYYFVKSEDSKNNPVIDLWLISQMENHIIANSTFSWWGAWLSNNKNKIVICPNSNIKDQEGYWMPSIYNVFNWIFI